MQIDNNKVVSFHYTLSEPSGEILDDSREHEPMVYLHGHNNIPKGLENAMAGKKVGDTFSVTLAPQDAYGERQENAIQRVSMNYIINSSKKTPKYKPGMLVQLNTRNGPQEVVIVKVGLKTLDVDVNHPLAGKTLKFDIEIVNMRDANSDEITHGHAHGIDGHHHHD